MMSTTVPSAVEAQNQATVKAGEDFAAAPHSSVDVEVGGEKAPVAVLSWKDLQVSVKNGDKMLLKGVSGQIAGGLTAVMGASGSGKSTLLNTLALRLDRGVATAGHLRLNGREYSHSELKLMSGYVMQDDVLNGNLTVEETLTYTARLRCPQDADAAACKRRVDRVINQMGLDHARDVIVGDPLKKGISGGERKRLCVAIELLTEPKLLFLDEPTSGLDSVTALSLCNSLRQLTHRTTVVCTIHQPQSKIFALFDNLILLQAGDITYQGPASEVVSFFEQSGFPCPAFTNPADHILDSMAISRTDSSHSLVGGDAGGSMHGVDLRRGADGAKLPLRGKTPWFTQFRILMERSVKEQARKTGVLTTQVLQTVIMAVLIGTAFLQIGLGQDGVTRRQPVLFFCAINQGLFGALSTINTFPGERILALRERAAGTFHVSAYFLSKVVAEVLVQLPQPIIFSCIVYPLIGLRDGASHFFIFMGFLCMCTLAATSLALLISAICRTTDLSVTVLPMALEVCRLFGGFFLSPADLPAYFSWLDALSYVKYTFVAISIDQNRGLQFTCTPDEEVDGKCPVPDGDSVLEDNGMDAWTMSKCAGILAVYIVGVRVLAYYGIRHIKW